MDSNLIDKDNLLDYQTFLRSLKGERNLSNYTIKNYGIDLRDLSSFLRTQRFDTVTRQDARNFLSHLEKNKFGRRSIARKISACRSFFSWLMREKKSLKNPFAMIATPKIEKKL